MPNQITDHLLMIRPANFGRSSDTVADNTFQDSVAKADRDEVAAKAIVEFDNFVKVLRDAGLTITVSATTGSALMKTGLWSPTPSTGLNVGRNAAPTSSRCLTRNSS